MLYSKTRKLILAGGDLIFLYLSLFLMILIRFWRESNLYSTFSQHFIPFSFLYLFWLAIFYIIGVYDLHQTKKDFNLYPKFFLGMTINFLAGVTFFYLLPLFAITPKTNLVLNVVLAFLLLTGWRKLVDKLFSSYLINKVAIIGKTKELKDIEKEIAKRPYLGYKVVFTASDLSENTLKEISKRKVDTLIFTDDLQTTLPQNLFLKINLLSPLQAYERICQKIPLSLVDLNWFLSAIKSEEKNIYEKSKRLLDICLGSVIFGVMVLLFPFIALAIKLEDQGPVFYKQKRVGKDKKVFSIYKFRSMRVDAEKGKAVWAQKEDPRITKIGRLLRKTHLDEFPQMINVLKGEMSLVGPRPERPEFVEMLEKEIPYYNLRHLIKPGFTGWAQLKFRYGRTVMDAKEKLEYDLYYLKNRSLFLDIKIILKTFQLLFKKEE